MCKFFGDAHRLLWVDPQQVLENGEERDFLRGAGIKNILSGWDQKYFEGGWDQKYSQIYLQTSNWCQ